MLPLHAHALEDLPSSSQSLLIDRAFSLACHMFACGLTPHGLVCIWPCLHVALFLQVMTVIACYFVA